MIDIRVVSRKEAETPELAKFIATAVASDYTIICQCKYGQIRIMPHSKTIAIPVKTVS